MSLPFATKPASSYITWKPNRDVIRFFDLLKQRRIGPAADMTKPVRISNNPPPHPDDPESDDDYDPESAPHPTWRQNGYGIKGGPAGWEENIRPTDETSPSATGETSCVRIGGSEEQNMETSPSNHDIRTHNLQKKRRRLEKRLQYARL